MQPLPQLESCLRLAFEARDPRHPSGISLASWFVRAPTRGRRRGELDAALLFPPELRAGLGPAAGAAIALAMDPGSWRSSASPPATIPVATREWLAEAAVALGRSEGFELAWAMLRAISELESAAQRLLGSRTPRSTLRQVLHGVAQRTLRAEPFAAFVIRVLKIAQAAYAAFRHAGLPHDPAWALVQDRLWLPYPTGRSGRSGTQVRGAYLPSLLQAAAANARKRLKRNATERRTKDHARAPLARVASRAGAHARPWIDASGRLLPQGEEGLTPEMAGLCFFALLAHAASERRNRGGPAGGLSPPLREAGFRSSGGLPDRTHDLAIPLLGASTASRLPRGQMLEAISNLIRGTLSGMPAREGASVLRRLGIELGESDTSRMLERARARLPDLARWLEENGRELLERT